MTVLSKHTIVKTMPETIPENMPGTTSGTSPVVRRDRISTLKAIPEMLMQSQGPLTHTLFDPENKPSSPLSGENSLKTMASNIITTVKQKFAPAWFENVDDKGMDATRAVLAALGISQYWPKVEVCL